MNRESNAWTTEKGNKFQDHSAEIGEELKDFGKAAKEAASNAFGIMKENAEKYYKQGVEKAKEFETDMEGKIKSSPVKSILIAAGVGLLLGALFTKK